MNWTAHFQNNPLAKEEITEGIRIYFELNKTSTKTFPNVYDRAIRVFRVQFIAYCAYIRKRRKVNSKNPKFYLKILVKKYILY